MLAFWLKKANQIWLKSTAAGLSAVLLFSLIVPPFAQASLWKERKKTMENLSQKMEMSKNAFRRSRSSGSNRGKPGNGQSNHTHLENTSFGIEIPKEYGRIIESWSQNKNSNDPSMEKPLVIHIQDAHGYYASQKNAANIIKAILRSHSSSHEKKKSEEGSLLVCIEGAWGKVNPDWLSKFPDKSSLKQATESMLRKGEITGEEYLAVLEPKEKLQIFGIEDRKIYQANTQSREMLKASRRNMLKQISFLEERLKGLKKSLFGKDLMKLSVASNQFAQQEIPLKNYIRFLENLTRKEWNNQRYPNISRLSEIFDIENSISTDRIKTEREKLLQILEKKMDHATVLMMAQASLSFRTGKMNSIKYHEGLVRLAKIYKAGVVEMERYIKYLKKSQEIDSRLIRTELSQFENELSVALARGNEPILNLVRMDKFLKAQKKFWDEKFSPQDWESYRKDNETSVPSKTKHEIENLNELEKSVGKEEERLGITHTLKGEVISEILTFNSKISNEQKKFLQESYYKLAFKRDEVMVGKSLEKALQSGKSRFVLIAGGFHTPGITYLLRQKGVSYIVIQPKLKFSDNFSDVQDKNILVTAKQPTNQETYHALVGDYVSRLEELKKDSEDANFLKQLDWTIDVIKNRLFFAGPIKRDGMAYVLGAYQGDESRVYFALEYNDVDNKAINSSVKLQSALDLSMGTLRGMPGTFDLSQRGPGAIPILMLQTLGQTLLVGRMKLSRTVVGGELDRLLSRGEFRIGRGALPLGPGTFPETMSAKRSGDTVRFEPSSTKARLVEKTRTARQHPSAKTKRSIARTGTRPILKAASIFSPLREGEKPKSRIGRLLYTLGEPLAVAPLWEEGLFRFILLGLTNTTLKDVLSLDPTGIGIIVLGSIGLFSAAHIIVKWIVDRNAYPDFKSVIVDFLKYLVPAFLFTTTYLVSFTYLPTTPIFSALIAYAFNFVIHVLYNFAVKKAKEIIENQPPEISEFPLHRRLAWVAIKFIASLNLASALRPFFNRARRNIPSLLPSTEDVEDDLEEGFRRGSLGSILFFDGNMVFVLNNMIGRPGVDFLMEKFQKKLLEVQRRFGGAIAWREGGDEFALALPSYLNPQDIEAVAQEIKEEIEYLKYFAVSLDKHADDLAVRSASNFGGMISRVRDLNRDVLVIPATGEYKAESSDQFVQILNRNLEPDSRVIVDEDSYLNREELRNDSRKMIGLTLSIGIATQDNPRSSGARPEDKFRATLNAAGSAKDVSKAGYTETGDGPIVIDELKETDLDIEVLKTELAHEKFKAFMEFQAEANREGKIVNPAGTERGKDITYYHDQEVWREDMTKILNDLPEEQLRNTLIFSISLDNYTDEDGEIEKYVAEHDESGIPDWRVYTRGFKANNGAFGQKGGDKIIAMPRHEVVQHHPFIGYTLYVVRGPPAGPIGVLVPNKGTKNIYGHSDIPRVFNRYFEQIQTAFDPHHIKVRPQNIMILWRYAIDALSMADALTGLDQLRFVKEARPLEARNPTEVFGYEDETAAKVVRQAQVIALQRSQDTTETWIQFHEERIPPLPEPEPAPEGQGLTFQGASLSLVAPALILIASIVFFSQVLFPILIIALSSIWTLSGILKLAPVTRDLWREKLLFVPGFWNVHVADTKRDRSDWMSDNLVYQAHERISHPVADKILRRVRLDESYVSEILSHFLDPMSIVIQITLLGIRRLGYLRAGPDDGYTNEVLAYASEKLDLPPDLIRKMETPQKIHKFYIPVKMDNGKWKIFEAYRIHHNLDRGPGKGGIRILPSMDMKMVQQLAFDMTLKSAIYNLPLGGAKGGIRADIRNLSPAEKKRLIEGYTEKLYGEDAIGPEVDIPAPDAGTTAEDMGTIANRYERLVARDVRAERIVNPLYQDPAFVRSVVTGKPLDRLASRGGGSPVREAATGLGVLYSTLEMVKHFGGELFGLTSLDEEDLLKGRTIAMQGFGNVGSHIASLFFERGAVFTHISDVSGILVNENGLDVLELYDEVYKKRRTLADYVEEMRERGTHLEFRKAEPNQDDPVLTVKVDILIPAALSNQIREDNAGKVQAKFIAPGANDPVTMEANKILHDQGIPVSPDLSGNAGGLIVSYFEMMQNQTKTDWSDQITEERLQAMVSEIAQLIIRVSEERDMSLKLAALAIAFEKFNGNGEPGDAEPGEGAPNDDVPFPPRPAASLAQTVYLLITSLMVRLTPPGGAKVIFSNLFAQGKRWTRQQRFTQNLRIEVLRITHGIRARLASLEPREFLSAFTSLFIPDSTPLSFAAVSNTNVTVEIPASPGMLASATGLDENPLRSRLAVTLLQDRRNEALKLLHLIHIIRDRSFDISLPIPSLSTIGEATRQLPGLVLRKLQEFAASRTERLELPDSGNRTLATIGEILEEQVPSAGEVEDGQEEPSILSNPISRLILEQTEGQSSPLIVVNAADLSVIGSVSHLVQRLSDQQGDESKGALLAVVTDSEQLFSIDEVETLLRAQGVDLDLAVVLDQRLANGKFSFKKLVNENAGVFEGKFVVLINGYDLWSDVQRALRIVFKPIGTHMAKWLEKISGFKLDSHDRERLRSEFKESFDSDSTSETAIRELKVILTQQ